MMSEEDLLQLHSALTEGLSRVIKFLLVISEKDHPPEELVRCLCLHILLVLEGLIISLSFCYRSC